MVIVLVYMDDLLVTSNNPTLINDTRSKLQGEVQDERSRGLEIIFRY